MSKTSSATDIKMSSTAPKKSGRKAATTAAPVETVATPAPVVAAPVAAVAPVAQAAPSNTVEAATTEAVSTEFNIVAEYSKVVNAVNQLRTTLSTLSSDMKKLGAQIPRELKKAQKGRRRRAAAVTEGGEAKPKKQSVFTVPTQISDALCVFLGVAKGTQLSRSEVTTRVCKYAKDKSLMTGQTIKADAPLRKLLNLDAELKSGEELKILNLQRFLKTHYIKPAAATASA